MGAFTGSPLDLEPYASQVGMNKADNYKVAPGVNYTRIPLYTHAAGAGTGVLNLVTLPAGKITILPELSYIALSQFATGADFNLGHRAYTQPDGTVVAEDDDEFFGNVDVGGGAITWQHWHAVTGASITRPTEYTTVDGLTLFVTIDNGNIEDTDTIDLTVAWTLSTK